MDIEATLKSVRETLSKVGPIATAAIAPVTKEDLAAEKHPVRYVLKAAKQRLLAAKTTGKLNVDGLAKAIDTVLKMSNFEDTNAAAPAIQNDPMQLDTTETQGDIVAMTVVQGTTNFAEDLSGLQKAISDLSAKLAKLIEGKPETELTKVAKAAIAKAGPATEKLNQIRTMLAVPADTEDYDLRWKVSCMVGLLADAAALETILGSGGEAAPAAGATKEAEPTTKAASDKVVWPANMAKAAFDDKTGTYKSEEPTWGSDSKRAS